MCAKHLADTAAQQDDTFEGADELAKELEGLVRVGQLNTAEQTELIKEKVSLHERTYERTNGCESVCVHMRTQLRLCALARCRFLTCTLEVSFNDEQICKCEHAFPQRVCMHTYTLEFSHASSHTEPSRCASIDRCGHKQTQGLDEDLIAEGKAWLVKPYEGDELTAHADLASARAAAEASNPTDTVLFARHPPKTHTHTHMVWTFTKLPLVLPCHDESVIPASILSILEHGETIMRLTFACDPWHMIR